MIVSNGNAVTALSHALTEEKHDLLRERWQAGLTDPTSLHRVWDLIGDISQDVYWAGLLMDIEHRAWNLFFEDPRKIDAGSITVKELRPMLAELKALTFDEGWWFVFDLGHTRFGPLVARQVPLSDWVSRQPEDRRTLGESWVCR